LSSRTWAIDAYLDDPGETRSSSRSRASPQRRLFRDRHPGPPLPVRDLLSAFLLRVRAHAGAVMASRRRG